MNIKEKLSEMLKQLDQMALEDQDKNNGAHSEAFYSLCEAKFYLSDALKRIESE